MHRLVACDAPDTVNQPEKHSGNHLPEELVCPAAQLPTLSVSLTLQPRGSALTHRARDGGEASAEFLAQLQAGSKEYLCTCCCRSKTKMPPRARHERSRF